MAYRDRGHPGRSTWWWAPATRTWPRPSGSSSGRWASICSRGPTEILVIADDAADPRWSPPISWARPSTGRRRRRSSSPVARLRPRRARASASAGLPLLGTAEVAGVAWRRQRRGDPGRRATRRRSRVADGYAPEHLEVQTRDDDWFLERLPELRLALRGRGVDGRLRRQDHRHQPRAAHRARRALHGRPVGRQVPQDGDLPAADREGERARGAHRRAHLRDRGHAGPQGDGRTCARRATGRTEDMAHDFDSVVDRRQTESSKWRKSPPTCSRSGWPTWTSLARPRWWHALRERAEHPFYGYGSEQPEFYEVIVDRLAEALRLARVAPRPSCTCPASFPASTWLPLRWRRRVTGSCSRRRCTRRSSARRQLRAHARGGAARPRSGWALRDRLRRLPHRHRRADADLPAVRSAQPGGPRVGARGSGAPRRNLPRAELVVVSDEIHCDLCPRGAPARADRLRSVPRSSAGRSR